MALTGSTSPVAPLRAAVALACRIWGAKDRSFLAAMAALALVLRLPRMGVRYWGDEAISIGIASHPLGQIPQYLRFDGSPPLYYFALHGWMRLFGSSAAATHTLSLLISLAAIPAAWWCAAALFGPPAARPAALLAAVSPYLTYYGTETRMYVLVGVLAMLSVTGWVRAVQSAAGEGRAWLALAVTASVALIYTHNWGLFLVVAMTGLGVVAAWWDRDAMLFRRSATYGGLVGVAFLPWLPSFWWQLHYTGAPWSPHPGVLDAVVDPLHVAFSWGAPVVAGAIAVAMLARRARAGNRERRSNGERRRNGERARPSPLAPSPPAPDRSPLAWAGAAVAVTVVLGWSASEVVHSWAPRYLGVAVVPGLVVMAGLFTAEAVRRRLLPIAVVAMVVTALPVLFDPPAAAMSKSNVAAVDAAVRPALSPGDLVITTALSELPLIAYYLPPGLRYATPIGLVSDPRIVNWDDLPARLQAADPTANLAALLRQIPAGGHVLLIDPLSWSSGGTPHQYQGLVAAEGIAVSVDVLQDPAYTVVETVRPHGGSIANPVEGILLRKTG